MISYVSRGCPNLIPSVLYSINGILLDENPNICRSKSFHARNGSWSSDSIILSEKVAQPCANIQPATLFSPACTPLLIHERWSSMMIIEDHIRCYFSGSPLIRIQSPRFDGSTGFDEFIPLPPFQFSTEEKLPPFAGSSSSNLNPRVSAFVFYLEVRSFSRGRGGKREYFFPENGSVGTIW